MADTDTAVIDTPNLVTDPDGKQWAINPDGTKSFLGQRPPPEEVKRRLVASGNQYGDPSQPAGTPSQPAFSRAPVIPPVGTNARSVPLPNLDFSDKIQQAIALGATPEQAASAAKSASQYRVRRWSQQALQSGMPQDEIIRQSMLMLAENEKDLAEAGKMLPKPVTAQQEADTRYKNALTKSVENRTPKPSNIPVDVGNEAAAHIIIVPPDVAENLLEQMSQEQKAHKVNMAALMQIGDTKARALASKKSEAPSSVKAGTKVKNSKGEIKWTKTDGSLPEGWTVSQ